MMGYSFKAVCNFKRELVVFEIEQKFPVTDRDELESRLDSLGAVLVSERENADTYFNHPCRDFAQTGEALRVRREDAVPMVTYKAAKLADDAHDQSAVKAREELEWRLDPGDETGEKMESLLTHLGFRLVATVRKNRQTYRMERQHHALTITIDEVDEVGLYAEVECVLAEPIPTSKQINEIRDLVREIAAQLGLQGTESRSYLRLLLAKE